MQVGEGGQSLLLAKANEASDRTTAYAWHVFYLG